MDLREKKLVQTQTLSADEVPAGHGFFTAEADVLFIPRMDIKTGASYLTGYDPSDWRRKVADYPLGPGFIHDAQLLRDGTAMIASSGLTRYDAQSRVKRDELFQIDLRSGKPVRRWVFDDEKQWMSHFAMLKDGTFLAVSDGMPGNAPGKAWRGHSDQETPREILFDGAVPPGRPGELLSLAVNEARNKAVVTNPMNARLLVVDVEHPSFVRQIPYQGYGAVFDKKLGCFIASGENLRLLDGEGNTMTGKEAARFAKLGSFDSSHSLFAEVPQAS